MPEIAEVGMFTQPLKNQINKRLTKIEIHDKRVLRLTPNPLEDLENRKLEKVWRIGKVSALRFDNGDTLTINYGMGGSITKEFTNNIRISLEFEGEILHYRDTRLFGLFRVWKKDQEIKALKNLGPDAISDEFNLIYMINYFRENPKYFKKEIKSFLMSQSFVAGIGNYLASEICYAAKIHPLEKISEFSINDLNIILNKSKEIIKLAFEKQGLSISNYKTPDGNKGQLQDFIKVYGKKVCPCGNQLTKIRQNGRGSYFCDKCQVLRSTK